MPRIFVYDGRELPDPNPAYTIDEVRLHYAALAFPELSKATTKKEVKRGDDVIHEFEKRVGVKGRLALIENIVFKCEASLWEMMDPRHPNAKHWDARAWDLGDDRIYSLAWCKGFDQRYPKPGITPPEVDLVSFLNKATDETMTFQYLGMEFAEWAPGWVFLILGERV